MGKASKGTHFRSVRIKVVRCITGPWKVSYLSQGLPQPSSSQTGPSDSSTSITPQEAEPNDVTHSCSSCTETAYSTAKGRELNAWDAVMDDMLKVSFKCSAPITTQWLVCREHGGYRCLECSATAVFCECCLKRTRKISCTFLMVDLLVEYKNNSIPSHLQTRQAQSHFESFDFSNCFGTNLC